jgi:integrase/recombinase XerD
MPIVRFVANAFRVAPLGTARSRGQTKVPNSLKQHPGRLTRPRFRIIVAVRSFFKSLVEDGLRVRSPVRRGLSGWHGRPRQGLVRRVKQAPWIPNGWDWQRILSLVQARAASESADGGACL